MKTAIAFVSVLACAFAVEEIPGLLTPNSEGGAVVLKSTDEWAADGSSNHAAYETSNGISAESYGTLKEYAPGVFGWYAQGSYKYPSLEGEIVETEYTADQDGFHPSGNHLPTPPPAEPIPEYISRALAYIETHKPKESTKAQA